MDAQQRSVIRIINSALTGEKYEIPADFDLQAAAKLAKKHSIVALFYYGALNCGISPDEAVMQELFTITCQYMVVSQAQMHKIYQLFAEFDSKKIEYMPLKGTVLREMYPKTEMRSMSDADILIKTQQYEQIKPIMQSLGYTEDVESDHEFVWTSTSAYIELHKRLIPSYNKDYYSYFGEGWSLAKVCKGTRYFMTDEDQMIYLFTHFAKHYRDAGIGIKHIVDLWIYRKNKPELDEKYIETELKKLQLYDFYLNIIDTLAVWFKNAEDSPVSDLITDVIFNSGVFGTNQVLILSRAVKTSKQSGSTKSVKAYRIFHGVFLPYRKMASQYPILKKYQFLLPFLWIVRIFDILLFRREVITANQKELSAVTAEAIDDYQNSLNFVGLDFNFKE